MGHFPIESPSGPSVKLPNRTAKKDGKGNCQSFRLCQLPILSQHYCEEGL
jgi:hypothetical protein